MKTLKELQDYLDGYCMTDKSIGGHTIKYTHEHIIYHFNIVGSVRKLVAKEICEKMYIPAHRLFRFFVSKTQAMPTIAFFKDIGFMIEKDGYFLINPELMENELFMKKGE